MGSGTTKKGPARPRPTYDQLPATTHPVSIARIWQYDQESFAVRAAQIPPPRPVDPAWAPWVRAQRKRHPVHRGYTQQEWVRKIEMEQEARPDLDADNQNIPPVEPVPTPGAPDPAVLTLMPGGSATRNRAVRGALSQLEYNLYSETWNEWMASHPDFGLLREDIDDVECICWETVQLHRFRLIQARRPKDYDAEAYDSCNNRIQRARGNLAARRTDRENAKNTKGGGKLSVSIAVLAGQNADRGAPEEPARIRVVENTAQDRFLEDTMSHSENPLRLEVAPMPVTPEAESPDTPGDK